MSSANSMQIDTELGVCCMASAMEFPFLEGSQLLSIYELLFKERRDIG